MKTLSVLGLGFTLVMVGETLVWSAPGLEKGVREVPVGRVHPAILTAESWSNPSGKRYVASPARPFPVQASSVPDRHSEWGWDDLERNRFERARVKFASAVQRVPDEVSNWVGLGIALGKMGKRKEAIAALRRAVTLKGAGSRAHEALGDVFWNQGNFREALQQYEEALKKNSASPSLRSRVEDAKRKYQEDRRWDRRASAHFLVKYRGEETDGTAVQQVVDGLERAYQTIGARIGYVPEQAISVLIYPGGKFWNATDSPSWALGLYDAGAIHLPMRIIESEEEVLDKLFRHEFTHAWVDQLSVGRAPVWLTEGLARYFEQRSDPHKDLEDGRFSISPLVSIRQLDREFVTLSPAVAQEAYLSSLQATTDLIQTYGIKRVVNCLAELAHEGNFPKVFETTFHVSLGTFQKKWSPVSERHIQ